MEHSMNYPEGRTALENVALLMAIHQDTGGTKTLSEIKKEYTFSHTTKAFGYESRDPENGPRIEKYCGPFGKGYKVHRASDYTKRIHDVEYWIEV